MQPQTKDLFLNCAFVAMVLYHDITIQGIDFLEMRVCVCARCCVRWHFITKSDIHRLDFRLSRLGRDVTITYAYQRLEHTHTHTKRDPASQSNSLIFLLLCWSFHHNKAPLLCWPLCIVFENGWHTQIQPHRLYRPSSLRLVMLKHIEVGSLSRMN